MPLKIGSKRIGNKFNHSGEEPLHWKLWHWWKKLNQKQINGKIFCAYSNGNSMVLAKKYIYIHRSAGHSREPRNIPMYRWSIDLWQRCRCKQWEKGSLFTIWYWENWTESHIRMKRDRYFIPCTKSIENGLKT